MTFEAIKSTLNAKYFVIDVFAERSFKINVHSKEDREKVEEYLDYEVLSIEPYDEKTIRLVLMP